MAQFNADELIDEIKQVISSSKEGSLPDTDVEKALSIVESSLKPLIEALASLKAIKEPDMKQTSLGWRCSRLFVEASNEILKQDGDTKEALARCYYLTESNYRETLTKHDILPPTLT